MSAFKRRTTSKQQPLPPGTRPSPGSPTTILTSTGIPSLDDIFGGGLPLSCSLLTLAPESHSAYGELVIKYFAAQGLACGQLVCVVDASPETFLSECMWVPGSSTSEGPSTSAPSPLNDAGDDEDEESSKHDEKIKIAWRYEQMKQFQTTVPSSSFSADEYCRTFDLTCRLPESVIQTSSAQGQIVQVRLLDEQSLDLPAWRNVLRQIVELLSNQNSDSSRATRICIPSLGSYEWGDVSPQDICCFLHSLRGQLRHHPRACAAVCLPPHLCSETFGGPGWTQKLSWLTDASVTLAAFTANPSLNTMFSTHHGFVHIHSLPAPHTLLPPSDKFSTLRGLTSSGENNLAFKCMRKRLVFETLHLDVEGGVSERRTTSSANALAMDVGTTHTHGQTQQPTVVGGSSMASVQVQLEQTYIETPTPEASSPVVTAKAENVLKKSKAKKKVAFISERPDLYDF